MNEFLAMTNKEFMSGCIKAAVNVLGSSGNGITCHETDGVKQFCLETLHSWGTAQCNWSGIRYKLYEALRKAGAVNISGSVRWNYVKIYFDKRKWPIKA